MKYILLTELAKICPFSAASLRQLRRKNTCHFRRCAILSGRRILIDMDKFDDWMKAHGNRIKENGRRIRNIRLSCMITKENAYLNSEI